MHVAALASANTRPQLTRRDDHSHPFGPSATLLPHVSPPDKAEAGGTVTALDGAPFDLRCRAVLGGAAGIHDELLRLLRDADAIAADPESPPG